MSAPAEILRRRYRRLLAGYPSEWRAANETVVLDTLLEATGPGGRWPPPREVLALLAGGARAWIAALRPDPGERGGHWIEGLQLGAMLLAAQWLTSVFIWLLRFSHDSPPGYGESSAVVAAVVAITFVLVLRGWFSAALVAMGVPAAATVVWAIAVGYGLKFPFGWKSVLYYPVLDFPEGMGSDALVFGVGIAIWHSLLGMLGMLPLLAVLGVLGWRGRARPRSWRWLLVPLALAGGYASAPLGLIVAMSLVGLGLLAALALAVATGEVRPAVALSVLGMPWIVVFSLPMILGRDPSSEAGSLATAIALAALAGLAVRGASHGRQDQGPERPAGGPAGEEPVLQNDT